MEINRAHGLQPSIDFTVNPFSELHGDFLYVVMEKGDTDLATFLTTRRNQIDDIFIRFYWSEMLRCVRTIHEKGEKEFLFFFLCKNL